MKKLTDIINYNINSALGWTLIHSIWQGFTILFVFGILYYFFKPSITRYRLGLGALCLQFIAAAATFFTIYEPDISIESLSQEQLGFFFLKTTNLTFAPQKLRLLQQIEFFLQQNTDVFVMIWLLGTSLLLLRLLIGFTYVQDLKVQQVKPVSAAIQELMNSLLEYTHIPAKIRLLESARVSVPMTIGWLKPVVLLPIGMISGLTVKQLEAILAHELAHIKRYDYLVNIFQNMIEILFFYHPATWVISGKVRDERENCCDDFAVKICGDSMVLAKALTQVANYQHQPRLAMAFGAKRQTFIDRIKRIIGINDSKPTSGVGDGAIVLGLILVVALGVVYAQKEATKESNLEQMNDFEKVLSEKSEALGQQIKMPPASSIQPKPKLVLAKPPKPVRVGVVDKNFQIIDALIRDNNGTCSVYVVSEKNGKTTARAIAATLVNDKWIAKGLKIGDKVILKSEVKIKNGENINVVQQPNLPRVERVWLTPEQRGEAVMANEDSELERNDEGRDTPIYANPILLNGQPLDYSTFSIKSKGILTLMKGKPTSPEAIKIPFRVYLRRNGMIVYEKKSATKFTQIEISEVLVLSKVGDQIIINPTEKVDFKAKRIINVML